MRLNYVVCALIAVLSAGRVFGQPREHHVDSRHSNHASYANGPGHSGTVPPLNATYSPPRPGIVSATAVAGYPSQAAIMNVSGSPRYMFWTVPWTDSSGGSWTELLRTDLSTGTSTEINTFAATDALTPALSTDGNWVLFAYNPPARYDSVKNYWYTDGTVKVYNATTLALSPERIKVCDTPVCEVTTAQVGGYHMAYFLTTTKYSYSTVHGPDYYESTYDRIWSRDITLGAGFDWSGAGPHYVWPATANAQAGLYGDVVVSQDSPGQQVWDVCSIVGRWINDPHPENHYPTVDILVNGGVGYQTGVDMANGRGLLALGMPYDPAPSTPYTIYLNTNGALRAYRGGSNVWSAGVGWNTLGAPAVQAGTTISNEIGFDVGYYNSAGAIYAYYGSGTARYNPPAGSASNYGANMAFEILVDQGGYQYIPSNNNLSFTLMNPSGQIIWHQGFYQFPAWITGTHPAIDTSGRLYLSQSDGTMKRYSGP